MLLSDLVTNLVRPALADEDGVQWTNAMVLEAANEAARAVCLVRPDANTEHVAIPLVAGTHQAVPAGYTRLHGISMNLGADQNTPGGAIVRKDLTAMNSLVPDWHTHAQDAAVTDWFYDEGAPGYFWVYPPSAGSVYVRASVQASPAAMTDADALSDTIPLDDEYLPAMAEWILYRLYNSDSEDSPNISRSANHYRSFFNLLQVSVKADLRAQLQREEAAS